MLWFQIIMSIFKRNNVWMAEMVQNLSNYNNRYVILWMESLRFSPKLDFSVTVETKLGYWETEREVEEVPEMQRFGSVMAVRK